MYKVEKTGPDEYAIRDVEIFATVRRERAYRNADGEVEHVVYEADRDWLGQAVERNRARVADGYRPPLHIRHRFGAQPNDQAPELIGWFRLNRVEDREYEGEQRPTIIGDFEGLDGGTVELFRKGRLPARSAEVLDMTKPEIDSVAVLTYEVPQFRFPALIPSEPEAAMAFSAVADEIMNHGGALCSAGVAYRATGRGVEVFQSSKGASYMDMPETMADAPADPMAKLEAMLSKMLGMLEAMAEAKDEEDEDGGPEPLEAPELKEDAVVTLECDKSKPAAFSAASEADLRLIELEARNMVQAKQLDQQRKAQAFSAEVDKAIKRLEPFGFGVDDTDELKRIAAQGPKALETFAAAVESFGTPAPSNDWLETFAVEKKADDSKSAARPEVFAAEQISKALGEVAQAAADDFDRHNLGEAGIPLSSLIRERLISRGASSEQVAAYVKTIREGVI